MPFFLNNLWLLKREIKEMKDFLSVDDQKGRDLVFYSEHGAYGKFYSPILTQLLKTVSFSYLTSDPEDPVFKLNPAQVKVFYIKSMLGGLLQQLRARALVPT